MRGLRITHAVVGCSDLDVSARLFSALGFTDSRSERMPAEFAAIRSRGQTARTLIWSRPHLSAGPEDDDGRLARPARGPASSSSLILDVNGMRQVLIAHHMPGATPAELSE